MSPTAREVIANKPLSGDEVRELIRADVERLLDAEGLLSHYMAYGRVGWSLTLNLHLDNPVRPESVTEILSRKGAVNLPSLAPLESAPLHDPSSAAVASGTELRRDVVSPNTERIRGGLPVTMDVRQPDGTTSQQRVEYPPDDSLGDGDVTVKDVTAATRKRWGLQDAVAHIADKIAGL
jgi:hypothetical protein